MPEADPVPAASDPVARPETVLGRIRSLLADIDASASAELDAAKEHLKSAELYVERHLGL